MTLNSSGFASLPQLTEIIQTNYIYWKELNAREEESEKRESSVGVIEEKEETEDN